MTTTKLKRSNFMFSFFVYLILISIVTTIVYGFYGNIMLGFTPNLFMLLRIMFALYLASTRTIHIIKTK